jgi:hypothetical protein
MHILLGIVALILVGLFWRQIAGVLKRLAAGQELSPRRIAAR